MKKLLISMPVGLLVLILAVGWIRLSAPAEQPAAERPATVPGTTRPEALTAGLSAPVAPAPKMTVRPSLDLTPEEKGKVFDRVALKNQVSIYVSAALRKDELTARAMRDSLFRRAADSRAVVEERRAFAIAPEEKRVLSELLGMLQ